MFHCFYHWFSAIIHNDTVRAGPCWHFYVAVDVSNIKWRCSWQPSGTLISSLYSVVSLVLFEPIISPYTFCGQISLRWRYQIHQPFLTHSQFEAELDPSTERPAWWTSLDVWWVNLPLISILLPSDAVYAWYPSIFWWGVHIFALVRVWHANVHLFMFDILAFQVIQLSCTTMTVLIGCDCTPYYHCLRGTFEYLNAYAHVNRFGSLARIWFEGLTVDVADSAAYHDVVDYHMLRLYFFKLRALQLLYYDHIMIMLYSLIFINALTVEVLLC